MANLDLTVEIRTRAARVWLRFCAPLSAISPHLARRIAIAGVRRLARYRIGKTGRWMRLPRETLEAMIEVADGR